MSFSELLQKQYALRLAQARPAEKAFREKAWADYLRLGLPDRKNEAWKYSSLAPLSQGEWREPQATSAVPQSVKTLLQQYKADFDVALVLNGQLRLADSSLTLEAGYELKPIAPGFVPEYNDGMANAVAATHQTGFALTVKPRATCPRPLLLVHCLQGEGTWSATFNSLTVGEAAQFQLAEIFVGETRGLRTGLTQVKVAEDASLHWARVQEEAESTNHFADLRVHLAAAATLNFHQTNAGASWARGSLAVNLAGERAETMISGLTFAKADHHVDQRIEANHHSALTSSAQLFKGILKDRSRGVLNGKIHIAKGAQKVISSQLNHNLLLNEGAEADTKPELEIFADDVKANHGASVGRLDEDKVFYLQSRGVPRAQARQLLASAFVADVLMKVPGFAMRDFVSGRVKNILQDYAREMENLQ